MNSEEIIKGETNWESIDFIINYNEKCNYTLDVYLTRNALV